VKDNVSDEPALETISEVGARGRDGSIPLEFKSKVDAAITGMNLLFVSTSNLKQGPSIVNPYLLKSFFDLAFV